MLTLLQKGYLQTYTRVNSDLIYNVQDLFSEARHSYETSKIHWKQIVETIRTYQSLQTMSADQSVPDRGIDSYREIVQEVMDTYHELVTLQATLDKVLTKAKETEQKVRRLNRVEEIIHRYNNL